MTVASFVADVLPDARIASTRTGVPVSVVLAQWGIETGWGTSSAWLRGHNYAGVSGAAGVNAYPDRATGLASYISTMNLGFYSSVRSAGTDSAAAAALGRSPWAASHYATAGGAPGSLLAAVMATNNLGQFDGAGATTGANPVTVGIQIPGTGITIPTPSDIAGAVTTTLRPLLLKALFLAGGVTLVVLAGWRAASPALSDLKDKAATAAKTAAVA
jgi:hypothetical protein